MLSSSHSKIDNSRITGVSPRPNGRLQAPENRETRGTFDGPAERHTRIGRMGIGNPAQRMLCNVASRPPTGQSAGGQSRGRVAPRSARMNSPLRHRASACDLR